MAKQGIVRGARLDEIGSYRRAGEHIALAADLLQEFHPGFAQRLKLKADYCKHQATKLASPLHGGRDAPDST